MFLPGNSEQQSDELVLSKCTLCAKSIKTTGIVNGGSLELALTGQIRNTGMSPYRPVFSGAWLSLQLK